MQYEQAARFHYREGLAFDVLLRLEQVGARSSVGRSEMADADGCDPSDAASLRRECCRVLATLSTRRCIRYVHRGGAIEELRRRMEHATFTFEEARQGGAISWDASALASVADSTAMVGDREEDGLSSRPCPRRRRADSVSADGTSQLGAGARQPSKTTVTRRVTSRIPDRAGRGDRAKVGPVARGRGHSTGIARIFGPPTS